MVRDFVWYENYIKTTANVKSLNGIMWFQVFFPISSSFLSPSPQMTYLITKHSLFFILRGRLIAIMSRSSKDMIHFKPGYSSKGWKKKRVEILGKESRFVSVTLNNHCNDTARYLSSHSSPAVPNKDAGGPPAVTATASNCLLSRKV